MVHTCNQELGRPSQEEREFKVIFLTLIGVQPRLPSETVSNQLNRSHLAARDAEAGLPLEHRRLKTAVETQQDLISEKKKLLS